MGLEVQPALGVGAEEAGQAQGGFGGDGPLPAQFSSRKTALPEPVDSAIFRGINNKEAA